MPESEAPTFVYQQVFQEFRDLAKSVLDRKAEPAALILVVPWSFDASYPPGVVVTRGGQLTPRELLACARQLRAMSDKLYIMLADILETGVIEQTRRAKDGPPVERRQTLEQEVKEEVEGSMYAPGTK
jgi:hypothetical protein